MKLTGWRIVISIVLIFSIILSSIFIFSIKFLDKESTTKTNIALVENTDKKGQVGYVIIKNSSVYFLKEDDLPDENIENINWDQLNSFMGHPSDSVLQGEPITDIFDNLKTGDKVEIWYSAIDESYPGQIEVIKIKKL